MNPDESSNGPSRLVPDEPLPPYSYVPGRFPHPFSDPQGHSFGHAPLEPPPLDPDHWNQSRAYLFGCDLFNFGFYWEAHETWEAVWKACGRQGMTADFLKGLIKLAAAGVKVREGRPAGVNRHAGRAAELFRSVREALPANHYAGLDVDALIEIAVAVASRGADWVEESPGAVVRVFAFQLSPGGAG